MKCGAKLQVEGLSIADKMPPGDPGHVWPPQTYTCELDVGHDYHDAPGGATDHEALGGKVRWDWSR